MAIYKRSRAVLEPWTAGRRVRRDDHSAMLPPVHDNDDDDDDDDDEDEDDDDDDLMK